MSNSSPAVKTPEWNRVLPSKKECGFRNQTMRRGETNHIYLVNLDLIHQLMLLPSRMVTSMFHHPISFREKWSQPVLQAVILEEVLHSIVFFFF